MQTLVAQQDSIDDQALAWVVCLRGETAADHIESFAEWLTESPAHRVAWSEALDLWESSGVVSQFSAPVLEALTAANNNVTSLPGTATTPANTRRWMPAAIAASFVLVSAIVFNLYSNGLSGDNSLQQQYSAAKGEIVSFQLVDGSTMQLNTDSSASVAFSDERRDIALDKGEGFFTVAHSAERPFVVTAGDLEVTAIGTAFNVKYSSDNVDVVVTEGVVKVRDTRNSPTSMGQAQLLQAGEMLTFANGDGIGTPRPANSGVDLAWHHGQLVFSDAPLKEIIVLLNRYTDKPVALASADIGQLHLSGVYSAQQTPETLQAVAASLSLTLIEKSDSWVLSKQ